MWVNALLWILAIASVTVGLLGTMIPILPGLPMIFIGSWLAAWINDYNEISVTAVVIIGVLTVIGLVIDWVAQTLGAKKAGASKLGIIGSFIGTILGIFTGLWGLLFMPLIGAAIGEFIDHQDMLRSGKVGLATWIGMLVGTVIKLSLAFTMVGILISAYIF